MADFGKIRAEGAQAHHDTENPYTAGTSSAAAWLAGWTDRHEQSDNAAADALTEMGFHAGEWQHEKRKAP
jgi:hypothetical protein